MSYSYQFRLEIIKLVTEQDLGIREVAKLHNIPHSARRQLASRHGCGRLPRGVA